MYWTGLDWTGLDCTGLYCTAVDALFLLDLLLIINRVSRKVEVLRCTGAQCIVHPFSWNI